MSQRRQSITDLLERGALNDVVRRARALRTLDRVLQQRVPESLRGHVQVANLRTSTLVLAAETPAWAARCRYLSREILREMSGACGTDLRTLRVVIIPPDTAPPATDTRRGLSNVASAQLEAAAGDVESEELRAALLALARSGAGR